MNEMLTVWMYACREGQVRRSRNGIKSILQSWKGQNGGYHNGEGNNEEEKEQ